MAVNLRNSTHEAYIAGVRDLILERAELTDEQRERLAHTKLMYGAGQAGVRGVCFFDAWENGIGKVAVVEIGAMTQESWLQLAGTTLHELAHVLAGNKAGHSAEWKALRRPGNATRWPSSTARCALRSQSSLSSWQTAARHFARHSRRCSRQPCGPAQQASARGAARHGVRAQARETCCGFVSTVRKSAQRAQSSM